MRTILLAGMAALLCRQPVSASFCQPREYKLDEIAKAPVLAVGRVISLEMANGPHFEGDPKASAPPQEMTAEVEVLRSLPRGAAPHTLKVRFTGRDGPDFSWCPEELPELPVGQVFLLPLVENPKATDEPWRLIGNIGYAMTTRVASEMREPALNNDDPRQFIIRELANSFGSNDAMARYAASLLLARQANYLNPELTSELQRSLQNNQLKWTRVLEGVFLSYASTPLLTVSALSSPRNDYEYTDFRSLPLARVALHHLPSTSADVMLWHAIVDDLPQLADEPYHPLFAYQPSSALHTAYWYLLPYRDDPVLIRRIMSALRRDQPGSSGLAYFMISHGQNVFLADTLERALKVIRRPGADSDDLFASVMAISKYGSEKQRQECIRIAHSFQSTNADYAAYLVRSIR